MVQEEENTQQKQERYVFPSFSNDIVGQQIQAIHAKEEGSDKKNLVPPESAGLPFLKKFGKDFFPVQQVIKNEDFNDSRQSSAPYFVSNNF